MLTPYAQLSNLFRELFDAHELRSFLRGLDRGKELVDALPDGQGLASLAGETVDILRRRGRVDAVLFEALAAHAPEHHAAIAAAARSWEVQTPQQPNPSAPLPLCADSRRGPLSVSNKDEEPPLLVLYTEEQRGAYIRKTTRIALQDADFNVLWRLASKRGALVPYSSLNGYAYAQRAVSAIWDALRSVPAPALEDAGRIGDAIRNVRKRGYRLMLSEREAILNPRDDVGGVAVRRGVDQK